jgi:D-glycero-alpha-D-manno-heptose-7-phosphate kinase
MIVSKTPFRISFFGGGSDYPQWYEKFGGEVISTTINKYLYISVRRPPKFYKHKYRILYSKDEMVGSINEIQHKPVREMLRYFKIKGGMEVHYDADLPARSGIGSSSAFIVGFLQNLLTIQKKKINKKTLAIKSIFLEKDILKEVVGSQDQVACSYGGFNNIKFLKNGSFLVKKINIDLEKKKFLEGNLFLVYSTIQRAAQMVAKSFVQDLTSKKIREIQNINLILQDAKKLIKSKNFSLFGELLNESWMLKRSLSNKVSTNKLDELYNLALESGASGGKLLGAGGGGFFVFYVKKFNQKKFFEKMKKIIVLPIKFDNEGSQIIADTHTDY